MKITVNTEDLYTKMEYSKKKGLYRATLDRMIKNEKVQAFNINGGTIIHDAGK